MSTTCHNDIQAMPIRPFELREFFHLAFLRHLGLRLSGRSYAVKGGICLRFFHRSPRLSQDMDLDIANQVRVETLGKAIDTILESRAFSASLTSQGINRIRWTKPKQTETTQRWKISLSVSENSPLHTKIEFSRRYEKVSYSTGVPSSEILDCYKMIPFAVQFYDALSMTLQKISALASPSRHAARDLFDLHHLLRGVLVKPEQFHNKIHQMNLERAAEKISQFSFQDFKGQVLPYLSGNLIDAYGNPKAFEQLKAEVEEVLLKILQ